MTRTEAPEVQLAREAAEWRLLSRLLSRPNDECRRELAEAVTETADPELREACAAALEGAAEGVYDSIFGPGGPAAPREASYRTTLQLGYLLSELEAYYSAFGYAPAGEETPGHVAVETDFVAYLCLKQALAVGLEQPDKAEITRLARTEFLRSHLAAIAEPLHQSLENSGERYLSIASKALFERVGPPEATPSTTRPFAEELVTIENAEFCCGS